MRGVPLADFDFGAASEWKELPVQVGADDCAKTLEHRWAWLSSAGGEECCVRLPAHDYMVEVGGIRH